ncbi:MAG TPA: hypothetical protein VN133_08560 [Humibacter sp.]|nr:hypothetical protein [Humibacter sp.]
MADEQREDEREHLFDLNRAEASADRAESSTTKSAVRSSRIAAAASWVSSAGGVAASLGYVAIYTTYADVLSAGVFPPLTLGPVVFVVGWGCVVAGLVALHVRGTDSARAPSLWLAVWFALLGVALTAAAWANNEPESIGFSWSLPVGVGTIAAAALLGLIGLAELSDRRKGPQEGLRNLARRRRAVGVVLGIAGLLVAIVFDVYNLGITFSDSYPPDLWGQSPLIWGLIGFSVAASGVFIGMVLARGIRRPIGGWRFLWIAGWFTWSGFVLTSIGAADMYWIVSTAFGWGEIFAYFIAAGITLLLFGAGMAIVGVALQFQPPAPRQPLADRTRPDNLEGRLDERADAEAT